MVELVLVDAKAHAVVKVLDVLGDDELGLPVLVPAVGGTRRATVVKSGCSELESSTSQCTICSIVLSSAQVDETLGDLRDRPLNVAIVSWVVPSEAIFVEVGETCPPRCPVRRA